jgi:hypothetical protein
MKEDRTMTQLKITPLSRPVANHDWMHAPITPERQAASEAWQKQRAALRQQFKREWVPPAGYSAERDAEEMTCIDCAAFYVWEERRKGRTAAASTPVWVDAFERWLIDGPDFEDCGILAKQPTAASLTLPIVLKGGGDMQVTFETEKYVDTQYQPEPRTWIKREHRLIVRTEHGVFSGQLARECGERDWYVISLPSRTPQVVADRIARTLDAINELNLADDYLAIMPVSDRCSICARPLTDIVSKTLDIGPDCADKLEILHSAAIADAIISKRRVFLAEEISQR